MTGSLLTVLQNDIMLFLVTRVFLKKIIEVKYLSLFTLLFLSRPFVSFLLKVVHKSSVTIGRRMPKKYVLVRRGCLDMLLFRVFLLRFRTSCRTNI